MTDDAMNPNDVLTQALYKAGHGKWFRKSDQREVWVDVTFVPHPKNWPTGGTLLTRLYLNDLDGRREIQLDELQRDYER